MIVAPQHYTEKAGAPPAPAKRTVFLVDDDHDDLALGKRVLENSNYIDHIICIASAEKLKEELNARYKNTAPLENTIILLDVHMPHTDGIALLSQLRESSYTRNIPVVMLTEDCGTHNIEKTYHLQASGYLTKPLRDEHLNHIHSVLKCGAKTTF